MITLELEDGSIKKFNLPSDKEDKLYALWNEARKKTIRLTTADGETLNIRLFEIMDCYYGDKIKKDPPKNTDSFPDAFKDLFNGFNKGPFDNLNPFSGKSS
jgi:hypothetical protein